VALTFVLVDADFQLPAMATFPSVTRLAARVLFVEFGLVDFGHRQPAGLAHLEVMVYYIRSMVVLSSE